MALTDNLVCRFLARPESPDYGVRCCGPEYLCLLTEGKDAVDESQIPALPHVVRIGQIHYVVADVQ